MAHRRTSLAELITEALLVTEQVPPDSYGSVAVDEEQDTGQPSGRKDRFGGFSQVPNFAWIEVTLLSNVFLSGFDATVTASTYTTIGNEFHASNLALWITTLYLITLTAFQPLYGSFSDVLGRRRCLFFAVTLFTVGCLGCAVAPNLFTLNIMRAIAGIGGGGLLTLATVINSDIIPTKKRGIFQAFQNLSNGLGMVFGASFGGVISDHVGWRWCFAAQIPLAVILLVVGYYVIKDQPGFVRGPSLKKIDLNGLLLVVTTLTLQVLVLTLVGNELPWTHPLLISAVLLSVVTLVSFIKLESITSATPIIPIGRFKNTFSVLILAQNFMLGFLSFAYLFVLPLLFQFVLGDTPSTAGLRLAIPSLSTPVGGIITGLTQAHFGVLKPLVYAGTSTMAIGNFLALLIKSTTPNWLLNVILIPANLGQGMAYPSCLFTFIFAFDVSHQATLTLTIYLLRSIGGVWGVSCVSAVIQHFFLAYLRQDLAKFPEYNKHLEKYVVKFTRNTDLIATLPENIRHVVSGDLEHSIRLAQFLLCLCCAVAFLCCLFRDIFKAKRPIDTISL